MKANNKQRERERLEELDMLQNGTWFTPQPTPDYIPQFSPNAFASVKAIGYVYNDGGRAAAGYKGVTGDCATRAISIAASKSYQEVYDAINQLSKAERTGKRKKGVSNARTGVYRVTSQKYLESLGWKWIPTMGIGTGCTVHLNASELPKGRIIAKVSRHLVAVIDGVIHDLSDCSRGGNRCVYGYYIKE